MQSKATEVVTIRTTVTTTVKIERTTETKAHAEWTKANSQTFTVRLHNTRDADIIQHLSKQASRQGYIKELIRKDIASVTSTCKK